MVNRRVRFVPLLHRRFSTGTVPPAPPRPITLGSRPILFISTFVILHQSLATLSLLPAYGYFYFTDSSTAFLVGPHLTSLLRKPLPFSPGGRTVEDVLDTVIIKTGWRFWNKWKGRKYNDREGEEIAKEVLEELEEKRGWSDKSQAVKTRLKEMKDRAVVLRDDLENSVLSADKLQDWRNRGMMKDRAAMLKDGLVKSDLTVNLSAEKLREWKDRGMESLPEFDKFVERKNGALKAITDTTAAYIVVKASAPLRLAVSLFLTPRLARVFVRRWG